MNLAEMLQTGWMLFRNQVLGGNLVSLGLASQPRAMVDYVRQNLFLYQTYTNTRGLPQKNVFEVLPTSGVETVRLGMLDRENTLYGEPWFHSLTSYTADLLNLCILCQILKPNLVFEIGTLRGYTAYHFALNTPESACIHTLDLSKDGSERAELKTTSVDREHISSQHASRRYCFEGTNEAHKITCLFGDSARFDYSPYEKQVDLFFIDGAHSYEYVRSDTLNALKCCHSGSVIAWHDYGRLGVNGVARWVLELARARTIYCIPGGSLAFMIVE